MPGSIHSSKQKTHLKVSEICGVDRFYVGGDGFLIYRLTEGSEVLKELKSFRARRRRG